MAKTGFITADPIASSDIFTGGISIRDRTRTSRAWQGLLAQAPAVA
jgi:hypothetical protein